MPITVRELKECLVHCPPEWDELEVYALAGFSDIPGWDREIGAPRRYQEQGPVFIPLFGPREPVEEAEFKRMGRLWREFEARQLSVGQWPFTEGRKEHSD